MLKTMRKNLKSLAPTLWLVIAAFIIAIFAVWGGAGRLGESRETNTLVTIDKQEISAETYYQNLRQRIEALQREFNSLDASLIQQLNIPQQVLEQLIQQTLLFQEAKSLGIQASPEEIRERIKSYPAFQKDGQFVGFEEYKRILEWNRISLPSFEDSIKKEIILEKTVRWLTAGVTVNPEEVWEFYKKNNESARIEYIVLETDSIEITEEPSTKEIKKYYEENREKYILPERREGIYVFISLDDVRDEIVVKESEIEKYYQENQSQFTESEKIRVSRIFLPYGEEENILIRNQAEDILKKIEKGEDFAQLAKTYSKDEKAEAGGDWGPYEWQRLSEIEKNEIYRMAAGETSGIIELEDGLSILKVTEKKEALIKPLDQVKAQIKTILEEKKAREIVRSRAEQLMKLARKEKSLDAAAQKLDYIFKSTGLLKKGDSLAGIDPSGVISQQLFQFEKENQISSPVSTYQGEAVVQLLKIEPERPAEFEEVLEEVKKDYLNVKKEKIARERIEAIKKASADVSLESLAEKYNADYKTVEEHFREQYVSIIGENKELDRLAFTLPLKQVSEPVKFENGYFIVRPLSRKTVTKEEFQDVKEEEKEKLIEDKKNKILHSFLMKLRNETGVKINYELYTKLTEDIISRFQKRE